MPGARIFRSPPPTTITMVEETLKTFMQGIPDTAVPSLLTDFTPSPDWPDWFQNDQQRAWETFTLLPAPARTDETWRYSRLKAINLDSYRLAGIISDPQPLIDRSKGLESTAARMVFVNNEPVERKSTALPEGVVFLPLEEAAARHPDLIREYFMREEIKLGSAKFAALHRARLASGTFLYVPANTKVELPIEIFHWVSGENASVFPHTLIVCDENSEVTLLDHFASADDLPAFACAVNDLHLKRGAHVNYVALQDWSTRTLAFHLNSTVVDRDAHALGLNVHIGGNYVRTENVSRLIGEGSRSDMLAVCPATQSQFFDQRTFQEHARPHTASDLLYLNALDDQSQAIFSGLIRADEEAHFIDGYQKVRNLLLSPQAEAYSLPGLEILADRVRCTHGATSGSIDPEQLFYLLSRGIAPAQARRLITQGFFQDVFQRLTDVPLRSYLEGIVAAKVH